MGCHFGFSRSTYEYDNPPTYRPASPSQDVKVVVEHVHKYEQLPNPNPRNFNILRTKLRGDGLVAEINYPDATNYEGTKILVFHKVTVEQLKKAKVIDPHFTDKAPKGAIVPVARFEPTERGWTLAKMCAGSL